MQKKDPAHEAMLVVLQTAKNRLEYLTQNDWMLVLDRAKKLHFQKGDVLLHQARQQKLIYLMGSGRAHVQAGTKGLIAHLGPGEICGEMAFLENGVSSASVVAAEDVEAFGVEWSSLTDLFELFPHLGSRFYRSLAVNLSRRLRDQILLRHVAATK
jgi:CRP-like cAMP-binding protein